jgi:hypothetical protein
MVAKTNRLKEFKQEEQNFMMNCRVDILTLEFTK